MEVYINKKAGSCFKAGFNVGLCCYYFTTINCVLVMIPLLLISRIYNPFSKCEGKSISR